MIPTVASLAERELVLDLGLIAMDLVGLVLGAVVLRTRRAGEATLGRDLAVGFAFAVIWTGATSLLVAVGLHTHFGAFKAATHGIVFVSAPLAVARGFTRIAARRLKGGALGVAIGLGVIGVYLWAHLIEPYRLEVTSHRIATPRATSLGSTIRVALLADVQTDHVGAFEEEVFDTVARARPDLVLLAGDYIQNARGEEFIEERARFRALFDRIDPWPPLGVVAVLGDIDPDPTILDGLRVRVLRDAVARFDAAPHLQVLGLSVRSSRRPIDAALRSSIESFDGYSIVLGHAPDYAIPVVEGEVGLDALLLAGHTHGGQIVIPGFGPPLTLTNIRRAVAAGGLHSFGHARVCVSRGTGMERGMAPRVRLFCRPQLILFELGPNP